MIDCICVEPLRVSKTGKTRIKPCPLHGLFGERTPFDERLPIVDAKEARND